MYEYVCKKDISSFMRRVFRLFVCYRHCKRERKKEKTDLTNGMLVLNTWIYYEITIDARRKQETESLNEASKSIIK